MDEDTLTLDQIVDEEHRLISSRRVEGTPVFDPRGEKLGSIRSLMINKRRGEVAYALLSLGRFPNLHPRVHPVPWDMLDFVPDRSGYVVPLAREQLEAGPTFTVDASDRPLERDQHETVYEHYGVLPPWGLP